MSNITTGATKTTEIENSGQWILHNELDKRLQILRISLKDHPLLKEKYELRKSYYLVLNYGVSEVKKRDPFIIEFLNLYAAIFEITEVDKAKIQVYDFYHEKDEFHAALKLLRKKYYKRLKGITYKTYLYSITLFAEIVWLQHVHKFDITYQMINSMTSMLQIRPVLQNKLIMYISTLAAYDFAAAEMLMSSRNLAHRQNELKFLLVRESNNLELLTKKSYQAVIIATMSSGKSTLLNALLGQNLAPSKNQACTAKVTQVHHVNTMDHITGYSMGHDSKKLVSSQLEHATLNEWNNISDIQHIHIEGGMPGITNSEKKLVLYDTPGSNYSLDRSHTEVTYRVLENHSFDLILYVINATQIGVRDDKVLLQKVMESVKDRRQKTQMLFVLNQVDLFDIEGHDNLEISINNLKIYLEQHGIERPEVIPVSSYAVKLFRMVLAHEELTKKETVDFRSLFQLFSDEMDLRKFAPQGLDITSLERQNVKYEEKYLIHNKEYSVNQIQSALARTGFPILESYINAFLK